MPKRRDVNQSFTANPTTEGAGVSLKRVFGYFEAPLFDPFLMMDDFRAYQESDFIKGFPWHPHRGIETITYVLKGDVEHGDSLGNKGTISSGDIQWMTAGSGIIHQEMPKGDGTGEMLGFQLWLNLPSSRKMCPPKYQDATAETIPLVKPTKDVSIKVICGTIEDVTGPIEDEITEPHYFDITVKPESNYTIQVPPDHKVFCYVIEGQGVFGDNPEEEVANETLLLFGEGDFVTVQTNEEEVRFLFITGKPLDEPISWRGPIVMNTKEEIELAFSELEQNTFIKQS